MKKKRCPFCRSTRVTKAGFKRNGRYNKQRYYCKKCRRFTVRPRAA